METTPIPGFQFVFKCPPTLRSYGTILNVPSPLLTKNWELSCRWIIHILITLCHRKEHYCGTGTYMFPWRRRTGVRISFSGRLLLVLFYPPNSMDVLNLPRFLYEPPVRVLSVTDSGLGTSSWKTHLLLVLTGKTLSQSDVVRGGVSSRCGLMCHGQSPPKRTGT